MNKINSRYANYYNLKNARTGYVFNDRYHSENVENVKYFLTCLRYIHQNPIKAGICNKTYEYKFSSIHAYRRDKGNYLDLVNTTGKNYFLGVKLNSNNQPTNAYACGIKDGTPFCIEGSLYEGLGGTNTTAIYTRNSTTLRTQNVFGSACTIQIQSHPYEPRTVSTKCETSSLKAKAIDIGTVGVGLGNAVCLVNTFGYFGCTDDYPSGD